MADTQTDFISPADIEDDILRDIITTSDINASTAHVQRIAKSLGVTLSDIDMSDVPQDVKDLAIAVACARRAKLSIGTGGNVDGSDVYALKHKIYAKEATDRSASITALDFVPDDTQSYSTYAPVAIEIFRG